MLNLEELYQNNKQDSKELDSLFEQPIPKITSNKGLHPNTGVLGSRPDISEFDIPVYNSGIENEMRANNQSAASQLLSIPYNMALEASLGSVRDVGRLLDFQSHYSMLTGASDNASNWLSDGIQGVIDDIDYDVYRTHFSEGFNPLSTGWWAEMAPQVASSIAMAVPAVGATKAISALANFSKLGKYKQLAEGIVGGVTSRAVEGLAEASEAYTSSYQDLINKGVNNDKAAEMASNIASSTYKKNWALAAIDIAQYTSLFGSFMKNAQILKQSLAEAGEEGFQYVSQKESAYEEYKKNKLVEESDFSHRLGNYIQDSEFINSLAGGALGGGIFGYIDKKLDDSRGDVEKQVVASVKGDRKTFFDISDDVFRKTSIDAFKSGSSAKLKEEWKNSAKSSDEDFAKAGINKQTYNQNVTERIQDLELAEVTWDKLNAIPDLSQEAKEIAISKELESRTKGRRYQKMKHEFETLFNDTSSQFDILGDQSEYKRAQITYEAAKGTPFEKDAKDGLEFYKSKVGGQVQVTPNDSKLLELKKDMFGLSVTIQQLNKEVKDVFSLTENKRNAVSKANEEAVKIEKAKYVERFKNREKFSNEQLQKVVELGPKSSKGHLVEVAQLELDRRVKEDEAVAKQTEIADNKTEANQAGTITVSNLIKEREEILEPSNEVLPSSIDQGLDQEPSTFNDVDDTQKIKPISDIEAKRADIEKRRDAEVRLASKSVYKTGKYNGKDYNSWLDVEGELNAKYDAELSALDQPESELEGIVEPPRTQIITTINILRNSANDKGESQDGVNEEPPKKGASTSDNKFTARSPKLIYHRNDAENFWLNDPNEVLPGTKIYFEVEPFNSFHKETFEEAAIVVKRSSDNKKIGYLRHNEDLRERGLIYNGSKNGIRYEAEISHKAEGKFNFANEQYSFGEVAGTEDYYIGIASGGQYIVPNNPEYSLGINRVSIVPTNGKVVLAQKTNNGSIYPITGVQRRLTEQEIEYVKRLLSSATAENWQEIDAEISHITYVGSNSGMNYPHLYLQLHEEGISYSDGGGTVIFQPYDEFQVDEFIDKILRADEKKRNVDKSLINVFGIPYTDLATGNKYPNGYNEFLDKTGVMVTNLVPKLPFHDPLIFFDNIKMIDETKKDEEKAPVSVLRDFKRPKRFTMSPSTKPNEKIDWEANKARFKKKFPGISYNVVENVANVLNDGGPGAWGAFYNAMIYIATNAPIGTDFHEACHQIFNMFLTERQRRNLLDEAARNATKYGITSLDDDHIEEQLMIAFTNVMLNQKPIKGITAKVKSFFKKLYTVLKELILPNRSMDIEEFFYAASNGTILRNPRRKRIAAKFKATGAKRLTRPEFTPKEEEDALSIINYEVFTVLEEYFDLLMLGNEGEDPSMFDYFDAIKFVSQQNNIKLVKMIDDIYDTVYKRLNDSLKDSPKLQKVIDNFSSTVNGKEELFDELGIPYLKLKSINQLQDYGFPVKTLLSKKKVVESELEEEVDEQLKEETQSKEGWQIKYGTSDVAQFKLRDRIKRLIRTLPRVKSFDPNTNEPEYEYGYFDTVRFVDFQEEWKLIKSLLADSEDIDEMVSRLKKAANTSDRKELLMIADDLESGTDIFRAQFFTSLSNSKDNYVVQLLKPSYSDDGASLKYNVFITSSNKNNLATITVNDWRTGFLGKAVNPTDTAFKITKEFKEKELAAFSKLKDSLKNLSNFTLDSVSPAVEYLSTIGVNIDKSALYNRYRSGIRKDKGLANYINFVSNTQQSSLHTIHSAIQNGDNPFDKEYTAFKGLAVATSNNIEYSDNFKDVKNMPRHGYANKVFLHKFMQTIRRNKQHLANYKNSTWAELMLKNEDYFNTFEANNILDGTKIVDIGRTGKKYEDYTAGDSNLLKINAFINNGRSTAFYQIPTPADNTVVRLVSFKRFDPTVALDLIYKHFEFELDRIMKAHIAVDNVLFHKAAGDTELAEMLENNLIQGYHFQKDSNKLAKDGNAFVIQGFYGKSGDNINRIAQKLISDARDYKYNVTQAVVKEVRSSIVEILKNEVTGLENQLKEYKIIETVEGQSVSKFIDLEGAKKINAPTINKVLANFVLNQYLANLEMANLLMGDISFYKKNKTNQFTTTDASKRTGQLISPGEDKVGGQYKMMVIKTEEYTPADGPYKGQKIDLSDAQGYVSHNRYVDIIKGTGRWDKNFARGFEEIESGRSNINNMAFFLQPIKGHYYGQRWNDDLGLNIPTQVKYSSIDLIPALTKSNPKLEMLRLYMDKHGIDEVVFDSAVKVGLQKTMTWEEIGAGKDPYLYTMEDRNWKWQQDVPQHHLDTEILYGTQFRKLILQGLDLEREYTVNGNTLTGQQIFDLYQDLISANVNEDLAKLNSIVSDDEKLSNIFKDEVERRELTSQYELALKLIGGRLIVPPTMAIKLEHMFNSLYNKVIKQKIKGGQFVQVSSLGWEGLSFVRNADGVITEAEVYLPWWSRKLFPMKETESGIFKPDFTKISPKLLNAIGYRIPSEAKYSMIQFKVKGFLPSESGSIIVCPPEVVKQMGSDFDIDKLFIMFYEWEKDAKGNPHKGEDGIVDKLEYDSTKTALENSRSQRDNMLLDLSFGILNNEAHFKELTSQNNVDDLTRIAEEVSEGDSPLSYSSLLYQEKAREDAQEGAKLIGLGANTNVNQAMTEFTNINLGTKSYNQIAFVNQHNGKTYPIYPHQVLSLNNKTDVTGRPIRELLNQFLAAFVDNAKNPLAGRLNINFFTFPIATLIIRTANTIDTALYFINQPVVKRFARDWKREGGTKSAYRKLVKLYDKSYSQVNIPDIEDKTKLQTNDLKTSLNDKLNTWYQKKVYQEMKRLYAITSNVANQIQATRVDSLGIKPDIISNTDVVETIEGSISQSLASTKEIFEGNRYPLINAFTNVLYNSIDKSTKYFHTGRPQVKKVFDLITKNNPAKEFTNSETKEDINVSIFNYIFTKNPYLRDNLGRKTEILKELANDIRDLKGEEELTDFRENYFIRNLNLPGFNDSKTINRITFNNNVSFTRNEQEALIDGFRSLLVSPDDRIRKVGEDLVLYSFYTEGFNKSFTSFNEYIPIDYLDKLGFRQFWADVLDNFDLFDMREFASRYLRNKANYAYVPNLPKDKIRHARAADGVKGVTGYFAVTFDDVNGVSAYKHMEMFTVFANIVSMNGNYYELVDQSDEIGYYKLVGKLGEFTEYEEFTDKSIIEENNFNYKEVPVETIVRKYAEFFDNEAKQLAEQETEFDNLPNKSSTPTMTYAGVGSRETPIEIQKIMTELAKELEDKGYTLRSGGASGADSAFERGVKTNKEIFLGKDKTGNRELKIAREIHPNPSALDRSKNPAFVWNLMARNTNQVFGKNLDTPVDFVIAWTKDGGPTGGTGQAIRMATAKGIPVINLYNKNWREQLDTILSDKQFEPIEREYTPENITSLKPNEVFVFGSNTEGRHGKGAALIAKEKFGAKQGKATGSQGQSYAIVTKNLTPGVEFMQRILNKTGEKSVPLEDIGEQLADLFEYAIENPSKKFYVTKLGSSLAGYSIDEIKNEIKAVNDANGGNYIPDNIILPKEYEVRDTLQEKMNQVSDKEAQDKMEDCK